MDRLVLSELYLGFDGHQRLRPDDVSVLLRPAARGASNVPDFRLSFSTTV